MSSDLFGSCGNGNPCPGSCLPENYSDPTYRQFGNTVPSFSTSSTNNNPTNSQKTVYGGLFNGRRIKQYASMQLLAKASLTTFKPNTTALPEKGTLPKDVNSRNETAIGGVISYTNVGGPGDQNESVPLGVTGFAKGNKARLYSMPGKHNGVDTKHGSYNRYLMRKKGRALRCSNC